MAPLPVSAEALRATRPMATSTRTGLLVKSQFSVRNFIEASY
jgi:hypothetical protein